MKKLVILGVALLLCACETQEQRLAKFIATCTAHDFTEKQCRLMFALKEQADADVAANSMASGLAIGLAAGTAASGGGYRR